MNSKLHNHECGYIAERKNPFVPSRKVVIYQADLQEIDVDGKTYAVVCDAHGTIGGTNNLPDARVLMKNPNNFCEGCEKTRGWIHDH